MLRTSTAIVDPSASLGTGVSVGPFCVIEAGAVIGDGCKISARATIKSGVTLGADNLVSEGVVLGGLPQHLSPPGPPGQVVIGDGNCLRENVTVHRAMYESESTLIGNGCLLMVGAHVAHDCVVGDEVVLTNNVMLAGHVTVGPRAYLGGGVAVHQHCRVGRLAMIGGMARVIQDTLPFVMIDGQSGLTVGLNRVGLRRAGIDRHAIKDLKAAYQVIFRSGLSLDERLEALNESFAEGPASEFAEFLSGGSRGFVRERRSPPGGTIRVLREGVDADPDEKLSRKAG